VASILGGDYTRAMPIVSSLFTVKGYQHNAKDDYIQILIAESEVRHKFPSLLSQLGKIGMVATVTKRQYIRWLMPSLKSARLSISGGTVLTVHRLPEQKARNTLLRFLPPALFAVTLAVVFIDGMLRSDSVFARMGIQDPIMLAVVYTMSLMGILGIHELGHMIAAKHYGIRISWPYFIPMFPGFFSPTLGAMIRLRSNMPNRNAMFDVGISGPIAGLIITVIVSLYGSSISVLIPADEAQRFLDQSQLFELSSSLLMMATMQLTGTLSDDTVLVMSPVMFAAWLGFLLTFLNLIPAAQLDGGHITRATLGAKYHRLMTFAGIGALFALQYPVMGALVLLMAIKAPENPPLDDVTPLSSGRRMMFVVALVLAGLCAPIPSFLI
jgi:membrane-associated protease RseP (regulator of RpoE activity)